MRNIVKIGPYFVGDGYPALVIAEIGINHNGDMDLCKALIDLAADAGAHVVKFQKRFIPSVFSAEELNRPRDVPRDLLEKAIARNVMPDENIRRLRESDFKDTRNGDQKYALEFSLAEYGKIDAHCKVRGLLWTASPWDSLSVGFLSTLGVPFYKVASASLTDDFLLGCIAATEKPVVLSTGGSTMAMIRHAVGQLDRSNLVILHCTAAYPKATSSEVLRMTNLQVIHTLQKEFPDVPIGFSSNNSGVVPVFAAVAMGASVVEVHITFNRELWGSDQASSVEPTDLGNLCRWVREHHLSRGDGVKRVYSAEREAMDKLRTNWGVWQPTDLLG